MPKVGSLGGGVPYERGTHVQTLVGSIPRAERPPYERSVKRLEGFDVPCRPFLSGEAKDLPSAL